MFSIFQRAISVAVYPAAYLYLWAQSEITRIKSWNKAPVIHSEMPYDGQKIMLLALYQKGNLRPDTVRLLKHAKAAGLYVLAVNTLRLKNPADTDGLIDCYIERFNFGRDFGSYRCGFLHLFRKDWHTSCPRLLMINDSVFFSDERMPQFLDDMMSSATEVLGSTENYDIDYHLGSFCIAFSGKILQNQHFSGYWHNYRLSDVRPTVIRRGELKLSRLLKKIVTDPNTFGALYSAKRYLQAITTNAELLDFAITRSRVSDIFAWKQVSVRSIIGRYRARYLVPKVELEDQPVSLETSTIEILEEQNIYSFQDICEFIQTATKEGPKLDVKRLHEVVVAELTESFMSGSQIHQNAAILLKLGLPIVKLDGLYRGIFDITDMRNVVEQLPTGESEELQSLLIARPYGRRYLTGWRKAAFERGLL